MAGQGQLRHVQGMGIHSSRLGFRESPMGCVLNSVPQTPASPSAQDTGSPSVAVGAWAGFGHPRLSPLLCATIQDPGRGVPAPQGLGLFCLRLTQQAAQGAHDTAAGAGADSVLLLSVLSPKGDPLGLGRDWPQHPKAYMVVLVRGPRGARPVVLPGSHSRAGPQGPLSIDGEEMLVNCSFYFKIGACRHGDRCSRLHNKPTFSQTIALLNIYRNPQNSSQSADGLRCAVSDVEMQEHYDEFFEEVFTEMEEKYGEVEEMNVCDNLGDHLVGNVYVKFRREEDAEKAVIDLNNRWFNGQPIHAELSPVTDFREACCRQYEMGECTRGGFCNFMHLKPISRELRRELYGRRRKKHRSRSRSRERRSRSRDRGRGGGGGGGGDRERSGRF
ncbi:Splicing factor U2AF 35 kDa subunit [Heterocephalus glaber]|uniref:Splicing factor U2AF 35 kDa subunit n=1 Tax=Heterocephalus glaber TaxID=10181 RepID=G5B2U9_HETGA|nr:Splicing factor U2AF 35 kDa subunit [Heterocephalus glaber]